MTLDQFIYADKLYRRLERESLKAAEARLALPSGSSRARVTSANAKWMRKAEARDRRRAELAQAFAEHQAFEKVVAGEPALQELLGEVVS